MLVRRRGAENVEKKEKTNRRKTLKNKKRKKKKEKRRIQGKLNNKNKYIWFNILYKNFILPQNIVSTKVVYAITFYLQFLCIAGYWKGSNDKTNLNIHEYTNYDIIEIYINRLSATIQIFIEMD